MKKRVISLVMTAVVVLTAVSMTAYKKEEPEDKLQKVRLNEVAHSIFYAPMICCD